MFMRMLVLLSVSVLVACSGSDGSDGEPVGPMISNISALGSPIMPGGQIQVLVSASSAEGATLSYNWTTPEGWEGESDSDLIVLNAPSDSGSYGTVRVAVSDGDLQRTASVQVATRGPVVEALTVSPQPIDGEVEVSAQVFTATGLPMTYEFEIGGITYSEQGSRLLWDIPQAQGGLLNIGVEVEDNEGFTGSAAIEAQVLGVSAWPGAGNDRQRTSSSAHVGPQALPDVLWRSPGDALIPLPPVLGPERTLYYGIETGEDNIVALDLEAANADRELWTFDTDGVVTTDFAIGPDGTVYATEQRSTGDDQFGYLYALDGRREALSDAQRELWRFEAGLNIRSAPTFGNDGTLFIVSSPDGGARLRALDPDPDTPDVERELWQLELPGGQTTPSIDADGILYISDINGVVYAIDPSPELDAEDRILWEYDLELSSHVGRWPVLGADGALYLVDDALYVLATDPKVPDEERLLWTFDPDDVSFFANPALGPDQTLYLGAGGDGAGLYALDTTIEASDAERLQWHYASGGETFHAPIIDGAGTIFVGANDGYVRAFSSDPDLPILSREMWTLDLGAGARYLILDEAGTLFARTPDELVAIGD